MAIRVRQGIEKDFDPYKLLPGEWAVSLDKKYVYMCFSAGEVRRMATYEAFEEDMVQIEKILAACENIQAAVEAFEKLAERHAAQADTYSVESESWAVGGTGTREEENTNNSKYYSQQSETQANRAKNEADRAASIANIDIATTEKAGIIKGNAEEFSISADGKLSLTSSYEEQETLEEIDGTEDKKTLFGKIAGAVRELIAHTGSKGIHYTLTNNLLANVSGTALDAVQGKALDDKVTELNNNFPNIAYISCAKGEKFKTGTSFCIVRAGICFLTLETTPVEAVKQGDIVVTGLPRPSYHTYVSLPLTNGNCYSAQINAGSGNLVIYYPSYVTASRIDVTLAYPVNLANYINGQT